MLAVLSHELRTPLTVTLPLTDERPAHEVEARRITDVRVLVVDDEADVLELLRTILAQCGARVTVAANAQEALGALAEAMFDVLVSDIRMPEEDGYALLRKVRALDPQRGGQIPALALTRIEDREAALSAGFQQHATKPIEPAELAAAVATLAGRVDCCSALSNGGSAWDANVLIVWW